MLKYPEASRTWAPAYICLNSAVVTVWSMLILNGPIWTSGKTQVSGGCWEDGEGCTVAFCFFMVSSRTELIVLPASRLNNAPLWSTGSVKQRRGKKSFSILEEKIFGYSIISQQWDGKCTKFFLWKIMFCLPYIAWWHQAITWINVD